MLNLLLQCSVEYTCVVEVEKCKVPFSAVKGHIHAMLEQAGVRCKVQMAHAQSNRDCDET